MLSARRPNRCRAQGVTSAWSARRPPAAGVPRGK